MTNIAIQAIFSPSEPITTQIMHPDGYPEECDHAGAREVEFDFASDPQETELHTTLQCDKANCLMWKDLDGLWRND